MCTVTDTNSSGNYIGGIPVTVDQLPDDPAQLKPLLVKSQQELHDYEAQLKKLQKQVGDHFLKHCAWNDIAIRHLERESAGTK